MGDYLLNIIFKYYTELYSFAVMSNICQIDSSVLSTFMYMHVLLCIDLKAQNKN